MRDVGLARELARYLRQEKLKTLLPGDSVVTGESLPEQLVKQLRRVDALVVLFSDPASWSSPNINFEVGVALAERKPVLPIYLTQFSSDNALPGMREREVVFAEDSSPAEVARMVAEGLQRHWQSPRERGPGRRVYNVLPSPQGGWRAVEARTHRTVVNTSTKADAVRQAARIARTGETDVTIVVHGKEGRILEERSYRPDTGRRRRGRTVDLYSMARRVEMAGPERRDVVPSKSGKGWDVTRPGGKQPVSHHETQRNAEKAAKHAIRPKGGEVVIHRRDGTIRDKDTIPPAKDPYPPKDKKH